MSRYPPPPAPPTNTASILSRGKWPYTAQDGHRWISYVTLIFACVFFSDKSNAFLRHDANPVQIENRTITPESGLCKVSPVPRLVCWLAELVVPPLFRRARPWSQRMNPFLAPRCPPHISVQRIGPAFSDGVDDCRPTTPPKHNHFCYSRLDTPTTTIGLLSERKSCTSTSSAGNITCGSRALTAAVSAISLGHHAVAAI